MMIKMVRVVWQLMIMMNEIVNHNATFNLEDDANHNSEDDEDYSQAAESGDEEDEEEEEAEDSE